LSLAVWHRTRAGRARATEEDALKVLADQGTNATDAPAVAGAVRRRPLDDTEYPLTVREAARFLGVSPQTVYLRVERKQIPHLRVMGRNIRFLKSDLGLQMKREALRSAESHCE